MNTTSEVLHCDKCRKKAYKLYKGSDHWKGNICGDCQEIVMTEARHCDGDCWYDFTKDQEPFIDQWVLSPYF